MLGLGEEDDEIEQTLRDLRTAGVEVVTFGQYLQPTRGHMKVSRYVEPAAKLALTPGSSPKDEKLMNF